MVSSDLMFCMFYLWILSKPNPAITSHAHVEFTWRREKSNAGGNSRAGKIFLLNWWNKMGRLEMRACRARNLLTVLYIVFLDQLLSIADGLLSIRWIHETRCNQCCKAKAVEKMRLKLRTLAISVVTVKEGRLGPWQMCW